MQLTTHYVLKRKKLDCKVGSKQKKNQTKTLPGTAIDIRTWKVAIIQTSECINIIQLLRANISLIAKIIQLYRGTPMQGWFELPFTYIHTLSFHH